MKYKKFIKPVMAIITAAFLLAGCVKRNPDMYYWGEYETLIYKMYTESGSVEADVQIDKLKTGILEAENSGKKVPPGVFAHLGFMYAEKGNIDLAVDAFNQEKALFPESEKFIDGMMKRAFKGRKS